MYKLVNNNPFSGFEVGTNKSKLFNRPTTVHSVNLVKQVKIDFLFRKV